MERSARIKNHLFFNHLPYGPLSLLYRDDEIVITYQDYDNRISFQLLPIANKVILAYILPIGNEYESLLQAICIFNNSPFDIHIYCNTETIRSIKPYSNKHLVYHHLDAKEVHIEASVIITYSLCALHFIKKRIPVIILGPNGFGGWVTPDNFRYLLDGSFMGRPHGTLWEYIPPLLLAEELLCIKECGILPNILKNNEDLAINLHYIPSSLRDEKLQQLELKFNEIYEINKRWHLIPDIASNIEIIVDSDQIFFKRKYINDVIGSVSLENIDFFKSIMKGNDFRTLFSVSGMEESDFWEIIYDLYEQEIIHI